MFNVVFRFLLAAVASLVIPAIAAAHPATGAAAGLGQGFDHPFTGIDHILAMVAVGVFAANLGGRALWLMPLTFMALMAIGGVLSISGVALPFVERIIALSVITLGLAVAIPRQWPLPAAMLLVGAFALFHGHAHGTDMQQTLSAAQYGIGFVAATGLLHLVGIALGLGDSCLSHTRGQRVSQLGGLAIAAVGLGLLATTS